MGPSKLRSFIPSKGRFVIDSRIKTVLPSEFKTEREKEAMVLGMFLFACIMEQQYQINMDEMQDVAKGIAQGLDFELKLFETIPQWFSEAPDHMKVTLNDCMVNKRDEGEWH